MARPTCEQIRQSQDFATVFRWDLQFLKFPNVGVFPGSESLNILCTSSTIPKLTDETIEVKVRGNTIRQSGIHNYDGEITLTFVETVSNTISGFLQQWREATWNTNTGASNTKEDMEGIILLTRLNSKDEPIWTYKLVGCFLKDYDLGELSSDSSDAMRPSLVLSYDYFTDSPV